MGIFVASTKVFDNNGKLLCELIDNEWGLNLHNIYKRNFDDNAIEVIDSFGNVILYAEVFNKVTIQVCGIVNSVGKGYAFFDNDGSRMLAYYPEAREIIERKEHKTIEQLYQEYASKIPRHFKYTGEDWFGQRLEN